MTRIRNLETVVERGLCCGCGLCESMAGRTLVEMTLTSAGYLRPSVKAPLPRELLRQILIVCPGVTVSGPGAKGHTVWGPVCGAWRCWATDPVVRHRGAAGGTLTALGCFLIDRGKVDAVVHVKASNKDPMLSDAHVSRFAAEVILGAQSRYGPAAPLVPIHRLLEEGCRIAVIAKPCDISAIRSLARVDERAAQQVVYGLSFFCGGTPTALTAKKIAAYRGEDPGGITLFRWRGNGWPGPLRIETRSGAAHEMAYADTWHNPDVPWSYGSSVQFRCKICPDAEGEVADVVCPDGWIVESGQRVYREAPGVNLAIARSELGRRLLKEAKSAGYIELAPFDLNELDAMHGDHVRRKLGHPARNAGLFLARQPRLRVRGYRSLRKALIAGVKANWVAFWGMVRRIHSGANREPLQ